MLRVVLMLILVSALASLVSAQCSKATYNQVQGADGTIVCPVTPANNTIEGSGSLANCAAWCKRYACTIYSYHANTTNCQIYNYVPNYYENFDDCTSYMISTTSNIVAYNTTLCTTRMNGYQLLSQRLDSGLYFNRSWADFKNGFGSQSGYYWIGNDVLSSLTSSKSCSARFDIQASVNQVWYMALYSSLVVDNEAANYKIHIAGYTGNATDEMIWYHNNMLFTTYDRDNDLYAGQNCALWDQGGFWHNACAVANINGMTVPGVKDNYCWWYLPPGCNILAIRSWILCH